MGPSKTNMSGADKTRVETETSSSQRTVSFSSSSGELDALLRIYVKNLQGDKQEVFVFDEETTIKEVKDGLSEIQFVDAANLRLIFKGQLLKSADKLSELNIRSGDTLHAAIMLRGGVF